MRQLTDTIAAVSTALGEAALAVVRISGDDCFKIVEKVFRKGAERKKVSAKDIKPRTATYGFIVDPETGEEIDEVILILYPGPKSYTTEDMAEIMCHGGVVSPIRILKALFKAGARLAEPGEFTKRAFLGGRIDLTEAEAVLDVIHAKTEEAHKSALKQLRGELKKKIYSIRDKLREALMLVEASVDFPEEDIEFIDYGEMKKRIEDCISEIEKLLERSEEGKILREGVATVIAGRPNVGKSSLLNALLEEERAIVTDIPGTTRDTIEEQLNVKGIPLRIIDTAGIRKTDDPVERIGVERSIKKIEEAELVLFVVDASQPLSESDFLIAEILREKNKRGILVLNKMDLGIKTEAKELKLDFPTAKVSAKTGEGLEELREKILEVLNFRALPQETVFINERHKDVLIRAKESLRRCVETIEAGLSNEFIAIDLKEALESIGEITGETTPDDILNMIFSRFCIGK